MPLSNDELARRADLALGQLEANGGLLLPEQANTFIDMVQEQPTILNQARVIRMAAPTRKINRLGFASRIMTAARNSSTQNSGPYGSETDSGDNPRYVREADRSAPTTAQIELTTKEVIAEIRLPYEVLEDNIEGQSFEAHVMRLIAERAAEDFEEWVLQADTGSGDPYLALTDGVLKQITSNVVDNASAGISPATFKSGMLAMPQKYLRNLGRLKHWITVADEIRYRDVVSQRATGYGDSMLTSNQAVNAFGVRVEPAPLMPVAFGVFTFPQNIIFGIQRQIMVETDKDIRSREIIIVLTARIDVLIDDEAATVKYINI